MSIFKAVKKPEELECLEFNGDNVNEVLEFTSRELVGEGENSITLYDGGLLPLVANKGDIIVRKGIVFKIISSKEFRKDYHITYMDI